MRGSSRRLRNTSVLLLIGLLAVALLLATQVFPTWPQHDLASLGLSGGGPIVLYLWSGTWCLQFPFFLTPACSLARQSALSQSGGIQAHPTELRLCNLAARMLYCCVFRTASVSAAHSGGARRPLRELRCMAQRRSCRMGSAGRQEGGSEAPGSTRWSQALAGLLPDFSGWRSPAAAPGGGTGGAGGALALARDSAGAQQLPKVR